MSDRKYKISILASVAFMIATVALATASDRLAPTVIIGQGTAITETLVFDTGHGSSNAIIHSDSAGNLSTPSNFALNGGGALQGNFINNPDFTGNPIFDGNPVFNGDPTFNGATTMAAALTSSGGSLTGTWSGSPTLTGTPDFSGGVIVAGGGNLSPQTFKVALFTGSLSTGGSTTLTAPSGSIIGLTGWNSSNFIPFLGDQGATGGATNGLTWEAGSSNTNVIVRNPNTVTQAFTVVMFYQ